MTTHRKLHFISGKYQGGTYILASGDSVSIGRGNEVSLTLFEEMVSRKHVQFVNSDGTVQVEDMGSKNGTFVNGERITQADLALGDRILIGTSIVRVEEVQPAEIQRSVGQRLDDAAAKARAEQEAQQMTMVPQDTDTSLATLDEASLSDPLASLEFDESALDSFELADSEVKEPEMVLPDDQDMSQDPTMEPIMAPEADDDLIEETADAVMALGGGDLDSLAEAAVMALDGSSPGGNEDLSGLAEAAVMALHGSAEATDQEPESTDGSEPADLEVEGEDELADLAAAALAALDGDGEPDAAADAEPDAADEADLAAAALAALEGGVEPDAADEADLAAAALAALEGDVEPDTAVDAEPDAADEADLAAAEPDAADAAAEPDAADAAADADAADEDGQPEKAGEPVSEAEPVAAESEGRITGETGIRVPMPCMAPLDLLNGRQLFLWQNAMAQNTVAGLAEAVGQTPKDLVDDLSVLLEGGYLEKT